MFLSLSSQSKTKNAIVVISEKKPAFRQLPKNASIRKAYCFNFIPVAQTLTTFYHPILTTNTVINPLDKAQTLHKIQNPNQKFPDRLENPSKIRYNKES